MNAPGRNVVHRLCFCIVAILGISTASGAETTLTTAREVRSLTPEAAVRRLPVELQGTVVFIEGPNGAVVIQDETAGTYFLGRNERSLRVGDEVAVKGTTIPGSYLPGIELIQYEKKGSKELPPAVSATYADFAAGRYFFQRVAVEGIVQTVTATPDESRSILLLAMGSDVLEVRICAPPDERLLVDSRVRIECLASGGINQRRQLVQPIAWLHDWSGLQMLEPAPLESAVPVISGSRLLAFSASGTDGHRVRVAGTVLASYPDGQVFIRDEATALRVQLLPSTSLSIGARIEVIGFPRMERFSASLVSANVARQEPGQSPSAVEVSADELLRGAHDNDLVAVTAVLSGHFRAEEGDVLVLQDHGRTIRARVPPLDKELPAGARMRVTGICMVESNTASGVELRPRSVSLRCRVADDVTMLDTPGWWTTQRLVLAVGVLLLVVMLASLWIVALRQQVRRQTRVLRRQIEHEATLEERQRIAREFHDTLEQGLTGLALRIEGVQARGIDEKNGQLLRASRRLISQMQAETRSLVSELREPAPELADIAAALRTIVEEHPCGCDPALTLKASATLPPLPSLTVHHLRMIAREAVTNALKHAHARHIYLTLEMEEGHLRMAVADDGCGFDPATARRAQAGHFGCIGIEERCEKLNATVRWHSTPGQGTTVEIALPLEISLASLSA
ncbi:sensor histidine kinase [Roseimicrobium gellanilyticum]|nr:sensor histidine kinase [Roseimicrobium gellanilyticum]